MALTAMSVLGSKCTAFAAKEIFRSCGDLEYSRPRYLEGTSSLRLGRFGLIGSSAFLTLILGVSACSPGPASDAPGQPIANGCYKGPASLVVKPHSGRVSQLASVKLEDQWSDVATSRITTENYGLLGRTMRTEFIPLYNIAAISKGIPSGRNFRVSSTEGVGGVGLRDRPFKIRFPKVATGSYVLEFHYTVISKKGGNKTYVLCSRLHIDW